MIAHTARTSALLLLAMSLVAGTGCDKQTPATATSPTAKTKTDAKAPAKTTAGATKTGAGKAPAPPASAGSIKPDGADTARKPPTAADLARYTSDLGKGKLMVAIQTSMGTFNCELFEKQAPITVANFVGLGRGLKAWTDPKTQQAQVGKPLYNGVIFHRIIPNFMIQGGDPLGMGMGGPGYQIPDEFDKSLRHDRGGLLSMANAGPGTGGSQFFVTEVPTPHLDNRHTVFGSCKEVNLVKAIAREPRGMRDRPNEPVTIKGMKFSRVAE